MENVAHEAYIELFSYKGDIHQTKNTIKFGDGYILPLEKSRTYHKLDIRVQANYGRIVFVDGGHQIPGSFFEIQILNPGGVECN